MKPFLIRAVVTAVFEDRSDAGKRLAEELTQYRCGNIVVVAIPRGGVPVAIEVAQSLGSPLDLVIPRKIPIPGNPEAGFGAITEDGSIVLNEPMVRQLGLTRAQINCQAGKVRAEIRRRSAVFRSRLPVTPVEGTTAILIDDGLASGFTMLAAIKSLRHRQADKVVVAVPVASDSAYHLVEPVVEKLVCPVVARRHFFAVASFYRNWYDLTDADVVNYYAGR